MDLGTLSVSSIAALISALGLLFGRLDARRARTNLALPPLDVAGALMHLRFLLFSWRFDAMLTQLAVDSWLENHNESGLMHGMDPDIRDRLASNMMNARLVQEIIEAVPRSGGPTDADAYSPWRSLIELLRIYAPEVANVIYKVYTTRRAALAEMTRLVLAEREQGNLREVAEELRSTCDGLTKAHNMVAEYVRTNFPPPN